MFGNGVNQTGKETQKDGRDGVKVTWSIKEDQTGKGNWQLVQSTNHGVSGRGGDSNTPTGTVRDTNSRQTRNDHGDDRRLGKVGLQVLNTPVLKHERKDQQDWNRQDIVVVHGVKVLEVSQFDSLSHVQDKGSGRETVDKHPEVTNTEQTRVGVGLLVTHTGNDGGQNHQEEGTQGHWGHRSSKEQNLTVCNEDDGQVLEHGVHWDGQELQGLRTGVDHQHEQNRDRSPVLSIGLVERSVGNDTKCLQDGNTNDTDQRLDEQQHKVHVEGETTQHILVCHCHQDGGHTVGEDRDRTIVDECSERTLWGLWEGHTDYCWYLVRLVVQLEGDSLLKKERTRGHFEFLISDTRKKQTGTGKLFHVGFKTQEHGFWGLVGLGD